MIRIFAGLLGVVLCLSAVPGVAESKPESERFAETLAQLTTRSFSEKAKVIEALAALNDERVPSVLESLLDGRLYYRKSDREMLHVEKRDRALLATAVLSGEVLGEVGKRSVKKISVNNALRRQLRGLIAAFQLQHKAADQRMSAAQEMIKSPAAEYLEPLERAIAAESVPGVRRRMETARSMILLDSEDPGLRLAAVEELRGVSDKHVMTILTQLLAEDGTGGAGEKDAAVREAAQDVLAGLHTRARIYKFVEDLFFGVSAGSVLLLAAIGLAITFGVMGVINMAHGEMIMLGAYTTYVVQLLMPNHIGLSLVVAVPAAFLVAGLFGVVIERGVIRFLYGRPLETLLATFGISLILQQLVRTIFTPLNRSVITPDWMSGSWEINGMLSLTYNRLYIILFSLGVLLALMQVLKRTLFGLQMRAVTQNRPMASSMGIRTGWVDAMTFGLGSGIAGIAGVALSQLTNVGPNLGQAYIIDSFMVVVFGGVGNLLGTFVGAMSLGIVNKFAEPIVGAVLAKILILVFVILFIQRRPRGLFALKGRFVED
ncbi:MAG TPA: urea ABC transporter permease subunit UrtB [Porticoccaceae bacterium]|nr:urea ABC transporter permease subunit UrtB [Porticoccaceae bacterium]